MAEQFDYIIVGSGSAGSVMAYRLSEAGHSVLVLEYGGTDRGPLIQMPSALSIPMNMKRYNWGFETEPEPHLDNRKLATPRGKVVGGSSSINGMVYVRGHAKDFDTWEEMGAKGWAFRNVQPYFKRMENAHGGEDGWRGTSGPMHTQPALPGLHRCREASRLSRDRRLQRPPAGRLRPHGNDRAQRLPLVRRKCLSAPRPRHQARQARHIRLCRTPHPRRPQGRWSFLPPGRNLA